MSHAPEDLVLTPDEVASDIVKPRSTPHAGGYRIGILQATRCRNEWTTYFEVIQQWRPSLTSAAAIEAIQVNPTRFEAIACAKQQRESKDQRHITCHRR